MQGRPFHETPTQAEREETGRYPQEALLELLLRENVYAEVRFRYRPTRRHANLKEFTVETWFDGDERPSYSITSRSMRACLEQLCRVYTSQPVPPVGPPCELTSESGKRICTCRRPEFEGCAVHP